MLLAVAAAPAAAQSVVAPAALEVLAEPDGNMIARLRAGGSVSRGASRGGFTAVTLDGWLDSTAVRAARGGPWTLIVRTRVTLRAEPQAGATPVAELPQGMGLRRVATRVRWVQVRREGWVLTRRLLPEVASRGGSGAGSVGRAGSAATGASRSSSAATTVGAAPRNQSPAAATAARGW